MDTDTPPAKRWLAKFCNFVLTTLSALLPVLLRLVIVVVVIELVAIIVAYVSSHVLVLFVPLPTDYQQTIVTRAAEWGWTVGFLGTLALWISERMKWQEKLDGIRQELEEAHQNKHWEKMIRIKERYSELRNKNPEARDKSIETRLANGLYAQAVKVEKKEEWDGVLGQLKTIFELVPDHDGAKRLKKVLERAPQEFDEEDLECLEKLSPPQARSLVMYLLRV